MTPLVDSEMYTFMNLYDLLLMKVGALYCFFVSPPLRLTNDLSHVSAIPI